MRSRSRHPQLLMLLFPVLRGSAPGSASQRGIVERAEVFPGGALEGHQHHLYSLCRHLWDVRLELGAWYVMDAIRWDIIDLSVLAPRWSAVCVGPGATEQLTVLRGGEPQLLRAGKDREVQEHRSHLTRRLRGEALQLAEGEVMEVVVEAGVEVVTSRITVLLQLQHQQHVHRWVSP